MVTYTLNAETLICIMIFRQLGNSDETSLGIRGISELCYLNINDSVLFLVLKDGNCVDYVFKVNI